MSRQDDASTLSVHRNQLDYYAIHTDRNFPSPNPASYLHIVPTTEPILRRLNLERTLFMIYICYNK